MADKDYGSILTRYLDPSETGFDTVVYQGGKPILDSEFVLGQEIQNSGRSALIRQTTPSGWFTGDFDKDTNVDFDFRGEADTFYLINKPVVNVNGWVIPLEYSNTSTAGENKIQLPTPPPGSGNIAADFVYLEVWRSLVGPDPSTDNKPAANKIYRHGNILSLSGEWLDDDLIDTDPAINTESTKRVQIQYRIKAARMNDHGNREGYTDADIYAQGPNAAFTTLKYSPMSGDSGMWRAGDGNPANSLNTVDGYVYSIPLCMVFRRNSAGFGYLANGNGGVLLTSGASDRPDGLYADEIVFDDVLDLRRRASLQGFNWGQELDRNVSMLMDQSLRSWATNTAHTGWYLGSSSDTGNRYLKADDLVPDKDTLGASLDPGSGNTFRAPDSICKVFSDRAHTERHIRRYTAPGGDWSSGGPHTLTFDLNETSNLGYARSNEMPANTVISDIIEVVLDDTDGSGGQQPLDIQKVENLGTQTVTVTLDTVPISSGRQVWVTYEVSYPSGGGLNAYVEEPAANFQVTVHEPSEFDSFVGTAFTNDAAGRTAIRDYVWAEFETGPHREVGMYYTTDAAVSETVISKDDSTIILPEHLHEDAAGTTKGVVSVSDGVTTYSVDSATSGRTVILSAALPSADTEVTIEYYPKRPLPETDSPITLYYMTPGIQAVNMPYLEVSGDSENKVSIKPIAISSHMYVGTAGSGAQGTPFPYDAPMNQIPVHISATYEGEHDLNAPGDISIDDFDANTGFLKLPVLIPMAPVDEFVLKDPVTVSTENEEYFHHYTEVDTTTYRPSAIAQSLSTVVGHKCFIPMVAQLNQDTQFAREGEHVLIVFSNFIPSNEENRVGFTDTGNTTCAAVYRLKGSPVTY